MKKITPNWSVQSLKTNLKTPLFYLYMIYPLLLTGFCFLGAWMGFTELSAEMSDNKNQSNHSKAITHIVASLIVLRIAIDIARFKINKRSWPAIFIGIILCVPIIGILLKFLGGESFGYWNELLFFGTLGPLMLFFGFFGHKLFNAPEEE